MAGLKSVAEGSDCTLRLRVGGTALLGIAAALLLQGCLLSRVVETRAQLCDEQPSRVVVTRLPGSGVRVVFEKPTLTDQDVVLIVGQGPSEIAGAKDIREFTYEARPLHRPLDHATGLTAKLSFTYVEGQYKLAEVKLPEEFNSLLSPSLVGAAVNIACKSQLGIVPPIVTFDLSSLDRSTLPTRDALTHLLGAPTGAIIRSDVIWYQYCLAPCDFPPSRAADLRFAFGSDGDMKRMDAKYFRYAVVVDLDSTHPTATVELH